MTRFGYLHDRLFWFASAAYALNRLILKSHLGALRHSHLDFVWSFFHSHFDDLLLIPAALPVVLWVQRLLGLRKHDGPPTWREVWPHLLIWSVMCKFVGPYWLHIGTPDPWDIAFFAAGGLAAFAWWNHAVRQPAAVRL